MKFKEGDKVKLVSGNSRCNNILREGKKIEFIIIDECTGVYYYYTAYDSEGEKIKSCFSCLNDIDFEYYTPKTNKTKTFMSKIIEKFKLLKMGEPQRSFVKAGIANIDGNFTEEGKQLFNEFLLAKFQSEFKTEVVDQILAADEKAKS